MRARCAFVVYTSQEKGKNAKRACAKFFYCHSASLNAFAPLFPFLRGRVEKVEEKDALMLNAFAR